jgi:hypothetical protein
VSLPYSTSLIGGQVVGSNVSESFLLMGGQVVGSNVSESSPSAVLHFP